MHFYVHLENQQVLTRGPALRSPPAPEASSAPSSSDCHHLVRVVSHLDGDNFPLRDIFLCVGGGNRQFLGSSP